MAVNLRIVLASCALMMLTGAVARAASDEDAMNGEWYTEENKSKVEVFSYTDKRSNVTKYYGKLIWFKDPVYRKDDPEAGVTLHDRENPDPARKADPLLGLLILKDFTYNTAEKMWENGTIYDPERGKTYTCQIKFLVEPGVKKGSTLDVRGYIGTPYLGRSSIWMREPQPEN